jgi:hypothetical protein
MRETLTRTIWQYKVIKKDSVKDNWRDGMRKKRKRGREREEKGEKGGKGAHEEVVDGLVGEEVVAVWALPRLQNARPFEVIASEGE